jgi:DNA-binding LytR/AlgR family response regulator
MPEIRKWHNGGIMDGTALDRVLVHVRRGSRVVKRAVDPADVYFLEADGGDTLVRMRGARRLRDVRRLPAVTALFEPFGFLSIHQRHTVNLRRVRELRPRDEGDDWEVKLDPPVNRVLPVARGELARLEAAFGDGGS